MRLVQKIVADAADEGLNFRPLTRDGEIENLFAIDAAQSGESAVWEAYFVESIVEYVIHARRPTGRISDEHARLLVNCCGEEPSPSVPALISRLLSEADHVPAVLRRYAADHEINAEY